MALPALPTFPTKPLAPTPELPPPPMGELLPVPVPTPVMEVAVVAPAKEPEAVKTAVVEPVKPTTPTIVPISQAVLAPVVTVPLTPQVHPAIAAMMREIDPHVTALEKGLAPSQRALAARALSGCRHASSDTVKMVIFRAAQHDANPMVRAVCIEELCKLGYFAPEFELYLTRACEDQSEEVRKAAKEAMKQILLDNLNVDQLHNGMASQVRVH